jgi:hypothetical protein
MWHQMPVAYQETTSLENAQIEWWHDARPESNWRLSWVGFVDLVDALELETWEFDFEKSDISLSMLLKLARNMTTPYYIVDNRKHTKIWVLDSRVAVMINLYGTPERWITNLKR